MLYPHAIAETQRLEEQIRSLQTQLAACPKGKLVCTSSKTHHKVYYKWYLNDGEKLIYLPKKKRKLAEQLAIKKYLLLQLEALTRERQAISYYLRHHSNNSKNTETLLLKESAYQELLAPYFKPLSLELSQWASRPYERNQRNPEHLLHKAASGIFVRSKSEVLIDLSLYMHKLPFRYECVLQLGESTIYPDFTIRHPKTGKIYYWEHFGLMDEPSYCKNACAKLQLYTTHGIIPSIQLLTTYETKKHPLNSEIIENIIQQYFL